MHQAHHQRHQTRLVVIPENVMLKKAAKKNERENRRVINAVINLPPILKEEYFERRADILSDGKEWCHLYLHDGAAYINPDKSKIEKTVFYELSANFVWDFVKYSGAEKGLTIL